MTVKELKSLICSYTPPLILRDAKTGKRYSNIDKYLEAQVNQIYPELYTSDLRDYAHPIIVAWVSHSEIERIQKGNK